MMKIIWSAAASAGMRGCECGICHHFSEAECLDKECKCCINFHLRSGPKSETHGGASAGRD